MFSAQQLQKFAGKKRITQETFDDAVRENIDEFEMEVGNKPSMHYFPLYTVILLLLTPVVMQSEEAVTSAVAEFEAQGVDLSNIITTATGGDLSQHPVGKSIKQLEGAVYIVDLALAQVALDELRSAVSLAAASPEDLQQLGAILGSLHAADLAVQVINLTSTESSPQGRSAFIASATCLRDILPLSSDIRSAFRDAHGPKSLATVITDDSSPFSSNPEIVAAVLQAAAASTIKDESGKVAAMEVELGSAALSMLRKLGGESVEVALAACALITSLTTADDESLPSSR